jgi:hypothetical protein
MKRWSCTLIAAVAMLMSGTAAMAGPWAEVGDAQVRSDVQVAAAAGLLDNVTMQWPMPWTGILGNLQDENKIDVLPDYVREAAERLLKRGREDVHQHRARAQIVVDYTNSPATVRGFDGLGRASVQSQVSYEYVSRDTAIRLSVGAKKGGETDHQTLVLDGSYIAHRIDSMIVYAGYMTHWWGPGWVSALSISNNARPIPQVGFSRVYTHPSDWWLLSWMGPWQIEGFVGVLTGPRLARNTIYNGLRVAFSPIDHLEIAVARTDQMCGSGHPCNPLKGYFNLANQNNDVNIVNDQGTIDIRYSDSFGTWAYEFYTQFMNEDSSPVVHSGTSHLVGGSIWIPFKAGTGRLTVEYTDSVATRDIWGAGTFHGFAYNNGGYPDGMRYRGRSLGFSLDSDSRLLSVLAAFTDQQNTEYSLALHHAEISTGQVAAPPNHWFNVVTTAPMIANIVQARVAVPFKFQNARLRLEIEGRVQDDQPRPHRGALAAVEARLTFGL